MIHPAIGDSLVTQHGDRQGERERELTDRTPLCSRRSNFVPALFISRHFGRAFIRSSRSSRDLEKISASFIGCFSLPIYFYDGDRARAPTEAVLSAASLASRPVLLSSSPPPLPLLRAFVELILESRGEGSRAALTALSRRAWPLGRDGAR